MRHFRFAPLLALVVLGCGGSGEEEPIDTTATGLIGTYEGTWSRDAAGPYAADSGTIRFSVEKDGTVVSGSATSALYSRYGQDWEVLGTLRPGAELELGITLGPTQPGFPFFDGVSFVGTLRIKGRRLSLVYDAPPFDGAGTFQTSRISVVKR